jgi:hypothetical protein
LKDAGFKTGVKRATVMFPNHLFCDYQQSSENKMGWMAIVELWCKQVNKPAGWASPIKKLPNQISKR